MGNRQYLFVYRVEFYVVLVFRHVPINLIFVIAARTKFFIVNRPKFESTFWGVWDRH